MSKVSGNLELFGFIQWTECGVQFCSFPIISVRDFCEEKNQLSTIILHQRQLLNTYALLNFSTSFSQKASPGHARGFLKYMIFLSSIAIFSEQSYLWNVWGFLGIFCKFMSRRCLLTLSCIATVVGPPRSSLWRNEDVPFFFNSCRVEKHTHNTFSSRWVVNLHFQCYTIY